MDANMAGHWTGAEIGLAIFFVLLLIPLVIALFLVSARVQFLWIVSLPTRILASVFFSVCETLIFWASNLKIDFSKNLR